jgi:S1-C subfamily serine protease
MKRARLVVAVSALLGAGALTGCGLLGDDEDEGGRPAETTRVEVIRSAGAGDDDFDPQALYAEEAPGVVTVVALFGGEGSLDQAQGSGGVGSGFVLNAEGEIATNAHVVTTGEVPELRKAREVYVEFADGNQVPAEVRGYDPDADIALLKVDPKGLTLRPLPLGRSESVEVGTPVAAIGSPFSERQSLSVGVVSAVDRSISGLTAFQIAGAIQTDAAINPGNSGGPLVNAQGEVIGVNQQIKSESGGGEGVGFAVPSDVARRSLEQLRARGEVRYAYLGVETVPIYPQLRERFELPVGEGAWLQDVVDGGPAAEAGLRGGGGAQTVFQVRPYREGGDVITRIGDEPVDDPDDLTRIVAGQDPGATVTVESWRDGKRREVQVKLGERPLRGAADSG